MNVLVLNWRDIKNEWAGGGEVYIFELAKRWVKMGHKVTLFCGQNIGSRLPDEEKIDGIKVIRKGGRYSLYLWSILFYFKYFRHSTDVIVDVQNGIPFFSVLYGWKPKVVIAYHVHRMQWFFELPFPLNIVGYFVERFLFPFFYGNTEIIAISKTTKSELIKIGFKKENIKIIYSGVAKKQNHTNNKKFSQPTILYLGRIKKYKRVDMLIKIMPAILKLIPSARLIIAGWGTEAARVTDASMKSAIRKRVKILGPVSESEKRHFLSKSWVFVNPSIGEGWGIAVIEANVYGTPTIAFKVNGLSESIQHKLTGFLVKTEDELIDKVCEILNDKVLRDLLGENAREWAGKFHWETAATKSMAIIKKIAQ